MNQQSQNQFEFGDYILIPNEYQLLRCGESVPITNTSFDLLQLLIKNAGSIVSEDRIFEAVWENRVVAQNNITLRISELRDIFDDHERPRRFIDNKRGRGYKFVHPVRTIANEETELVTAPMTAFSPKPKKPNYRQWTNEVTGFTETVKIGWSWPAFLFGGLWGFAKRMLLVGSCMLGATLLLAYAIAITLSDEDFSYLSFFAKLVLGLLFGAYGNRWREWHLRRHGFVPGQPYVFTPIKDFFEEFLLKLKATWRKNLFNKVALGMLVTIIGFGLAYWFSPDSPATDKYLNNHHFSVITCNSAQLNGHVEPNGEITTAWFEWGETPDLGKETLRQHFTEPTKFYQDLIGLKSNTTYWVRTLAENNNGTSEGQVFSFTTAANCTGSNP